jgi:hypothetical protein
MLLFITILVLIFIILFIAIAFVLFTEVFKLYCHLFQWLRRGFWLVNRFIGSSLVVTTISSYTSIFKYLIAWYIKQSMYIKSVRNATNYFFPLPLLLNATCFGPTWPSSGV